MNDSLQAQWQNLRARYMQLSPSDRLALHVLVAFLCVVLMYVGLWRPVAHWSKDSKNAYQTKQSLVEWMQANRGQVASSAGNRQQARPAGRSLLSLVTKSAAQQKISLVRYEPKSDGGIRVWLDNVNFNALMRWLLSIERQYAIQVQNISIDKDSLDGMVRATVVLSDQ